MRATSLAASRISSSTSLLRSDWGSCRCRHGRPTSLPSTSILTRGSSFPDQPARAPMHNSCYSFADTAMTSSQHTSLLAPPTPSPSATSTPSPTPHYHEPDVVVVQAAAMSDREYEKHRMQTPQSVNHFACEFDPSARNGFALILRFGVDGHGTFEELSRQDVLKMTQEVATEGVGNMTASEAEAVVHAAHMTCANNGDAPFGKIVDVQRVHARDIRKLDNAFSVTNEASIELRNQAILICADPLRAIIMRNGCLVFVPDGADSLLLLLQRNFTWAAMDNEQTPFEFRALEALLSTLSHFFSHDYDKTAPTIAATLDRLADGTTSASELEKLRSFKNSMNEFESQVDGVRRALLEILDNEEDLRLLYLTKLHSDPSLLSDLWSYDSEEAEVLIENYLQEIVSTRTKALLMQHRIQNTESLVMLKLDSMRNYLLGVDIFFSIVAISISIGTFIGGVFGMNLKSSLETAEGWFWSVTSGTIVLMLTVITSGVYYFHRKGVFVQK